MADASMDKAESQLIWATAICLVFMIAEIIGGYLAGSLAIMTDAAHLLSDIAGFSVSLVCIWLARRKATAAMSFGFKRAEVLGALLSVSLIWVVTGFLLVEAVERTSLIINEDSSYQPVNGKLMFLVALLGLLCNLIILRVLGHSHSHGGVGGDSHGHSHPEKHESHGHSHDQGGSHSHSSAHDHAHSHEDHGHSHGDDEHELESTRSSTPPLLGENEHEMNGLSIRFSVVSDYGAIDSPSGNHSHDLEQNQNLNIEAAYIHALGDFLQSIGVIIAGGLIWMYPASSHPRMQLFDPFATFIFSLLVLYSTMQVLKTSVNVLMEGVPAGLEPNKIKRSIERLPGVMECHDLHIWSLSLGNPFLSVHVVLAPGAEGDVVLRDVHHLLYSKFRISHATVQMEPETHYNDARLKKNMDCHQYEEGEA